MMVTDEAKDKIFEYITAYRENTQKNDIFFRIYVYPENCYKYKMGLDNSINENDEVQDFGDFQIRIDKPSADKLIYSTLEFVDKEGKFGFNISSTEERECTLHNKKGI
jgi:Fe-S cluster assembly iron-binding protein IscA